MSVMSLQRSGFARVAASRVSGVARPAVAINRRCAVKVDAFRDDRSAGSKLKSQASNLTSKAKQATKQASQQTKQATRQATQQAKQAASRQGTSSNRSNKQRTALGPRAPRNQKENSESVVAFVAVATLFLTGVLFVFPALLGGSPATTKPLQSTINKTFGIKEPADTAGPSYAPGPGPAAAPGSPATRM